MEEKLIEAKSTNSNAHIREHVQAIKTLCEVILMDEGQSERHTNEPYNQKLFHINHNQRLLILRIRQLHLY